MDTFDFAFWVGYAPVTGIFLGQISYGRTIRECLIVNLILPSVFGIIWFGVWGNTAINMQLTGQADLIGIIQNSNAVMGLFEFMKHLPFADYISSSKLIYHLNFFHNICRCYSKQHRFYVY